MTFFLCTELGQLRQVSKLVSKGPRSVLLGMASNGLVLNP